MLESIANMMIATMDLVEAEGRSLHKQLVRLATAMGLMIIGLLLALLGIGFLLYGFFCLVAQQMSAPAAAVVFGTVAVCIAGGVVWTAREMIK
ncbi:MAG TPA: hypothetical protein VHS31_19785 [Tepidisphaeraceae bacterium]|jgi:hypothetical protein|nr:hypothetical protein [Tepidisphaeraceae bacterium]